METPTKPLKPIPEPATEEEDRTTRRILRTLLGILLAAAVGLLTLLIWLLWPREERVPPAREAPAGYPIQVVAVITGYGDRPAERLKTPLGVAFDEAGQVWISDTGHGRVLVFTVEGDLVRKVGEDGPGRLAAPYGIAVDPERDRVYVADWGGRMVQAYSTSGTYIEHLPADDQDLGVFGAEGFSPYGVQVADGRVMASSNDGLYRFDSTGRVVERWGGEVRGVKLGMFNFPDAFALDASTGRLFVADTMNRRVVAMDDGGRWLWVSGRPDAWGQIRGFWQLPRGIAIGPDGNLYVVDTFRFDEDGVGTGHIVVLSPSGDLVSEFGRVGVADDSFNFPEHIAVREDGLFALADRENHRVVLFRLGPLPSPDPQEMNAYRESMTHPDDVWSTPRLPG